MAIDPATGQEIVDTSLLNNTTAAVANANVSPESLVSNQLTSILGQDSPISKLAKSRSNEQANQLGLLSSSLAVGAGQKAVIDSALPIAQQDATTFANAGTAKNLETSQINLANVQGNIAGGLQSQQDIAALDRLNTQEAGALERTNLTEAGSLARTNIGEQGAFERTQLGEAGSLARTKLGEAGSLTRANIASLDSLTIAANKLDAENTGDTQQLMASILDGYSTNLITIQQTPNTTLNAAGKANLINDLNISTQSTMQAVADLGGVTMDWNSGITSVSNNLVVNKENTAKLQTQLDSIKALESPLFPASGFVAGFQDELNRTGTLSASSLATINKFSLNT